ncbi:unnamed protein product [Onchocerca flexuosa]|uniref:Autophagy-related protein 101 n=1 Tax=Onchocerca flexuosa TaxID=387005 RepID=A0A183HF83_9BILA|nr:unnamed protein product [Onchocerca flexuosa]
MGKNSRMNARNHQFQLTVDEHQVRDAISTVFHTILLHRSVPKMHYTSEINFQLGSIGVEEVDCNTLNLSYVRVNSSKLVSCLHEEIDAFVQCIRHSIESVTAPRFYSPPPVSLLTHYGTPLLNAKLVLVLLFSENKIILKKFSYILYIYIYIYIYICSEKLIFKTCIGFHI